MECQKCKIWNISALQNGYDIGICEECFNKFYVKVNLSYQPKLSKQEDCNCPNRYLLNGTYAGKYCRCGVLKKFSSQCDENIECDFCEGKCKCLL